MRLRVQVRAFLRALPCETAPVVRCGTTLLSKEGVSAVVTAVHDYRAAGTTQHKVTSKALLC
jgi:hypothetical protein